MASKKTENKNIDDDSDEDDVDYQPPEETPDKPEPKEKLLKNPPRQPLPPALTDDLEEDERATMETPTPTANASPDKKDTGNDQPLKRPRSEQTPKSSSKAINDLWAEMSAGVLADTPSSKKKKSASDNMFSDWLNLSAPKESVPKALPNLADLEAKQNRENDDKLRQRSAKSQKSRTGLERALSLVRGIENDNMLDKTRSSWQEFKTDDQIREELDHHKKDKSRYTDRVAFLERSDVREWEYEQQGKKTRR